jgi:hypothetical protein
VSITSLTRRAANSDFAAYPVELGTIKAWFLTCERQPKRWLLESKEQILDESSADRTLEPATVRFARFSDVNSLTNIGQRVQFMQGLTPIFVQERFESSNRRIAK